MKIMLIQYAELGMSRGSNLTEVSEARLVLEKAGSNLKIYQ